MVSILMAHAIALPEVSNVIRVLAADATRMNSQLLAAALERDKPTFRFSIQCRTREESSLRSPKKSPQ